MFHYTAGHFTKSKLFIDNRIHEKLNATSHRPMSVDSASYLLWRYRVNSSSLPIASRSRSSELNPCDFQLWGVLKDYCMKEAYGL